MNRDILLVDDDERLRDLLKDYLSEKSLNIFTCQDFEEAKEVLKFFIFDLIILDRMMPTGDGIKLISIIKQISSTPVIMLTAMGEDENKIEGLKIGADDYLSKPFSHKELMARVEAVIRRTYPEKFSKTLDYRDVSIDLKSHKVFRNKAEIKLSPKEFDLLKHFLIYPKQVFSREQLLDQIWGLDSDLEIRTVDVHIRRLRKAINLEGLSALIRTVRSTGYSLD